MKKIDKGLMLRFFQRETTEAENQILAEWIKADPSHKEAFEKEYDLFVVSQVVLSSGSVRNIREEGGKKTVIRRFVYSAAVAASLASGWVINQIFIAKPALDKLEKTVLVSEAQPGQRSTVFLSDGTKVDLNAGSSITYPAIFHGDSRSVKLNGEAIFEVVKDTGKPFIVETFAYDVKVLGTTFDVVADTETGEFSTSLLEGRVEILDKRHQTVTTLEPNMTVRISGNRLVRSIDADHDALQWRDGIISLGGLSYGECLRKLEKVYGVHIKSDLSAEPTKRFTYLKIRVSDGVDHALDMLHLGSKIKYKYNEQNNTYYITNN